MTNSIAATTNGMNRVAKNCAGLAAGLSAGAALMYFCDADRGRARRKRFADEIFSALRRKENTLEKRGRDVLNRVAGAIAEEVSAIKPREHVDDGALVERVRSRMGHVTGQAHEIRVTARNGAIELEGGALSHAEKRRLLEVVRAIPGVRRVDDRLSAKSMFPPGLLIGLAAGLTAFSRLASRRRAAGA